jgi:hypothetical protein
MEMGTPAHGAAPMTAHRFDPVHPPFRRPTDNKEQYDG